jgi:hypothetical protein
MLDGLNGPDIMGDQTTLNGSCRVRHDKFVRKPQHHPEGA